MGLALGPRSGPNTLTIGDAAGTVNPFNGEGIAYGYETGRVAAAVVAEALLANDSSLLGLYDERLESAYSDYYKVARAFVRMSFGLVRRCFEGCLSISTAIVIASVTWRPS